MIKKNKKITDGYMHVFPEFSQQDQIKIKILIRVPSSKEWAFSKSRSGGEPTQA